MSDYASTIGKAINGTRLGARHAEMAKIGRTPDGGVTRLALTDDDIAGRTLFLDWAHQRGFTAYIDPIGNLFVRREGTDPEATPVVTGSHLDSQPNAGKYDGTYGVLAGLEVLETLEDMKLTHRRPMEVVVWTNEEGCRFEPSCTGSAAFAGIHGLETYLATEDDEGVSIASALVAQQALLRDKCQIRTLSVPFHAYIESHIEQGPVLEQAGQTIGIVSGIQGMKRYIVTVKGQQGHAGTVPQTLRADALTGAIQFINQIYSSAIKDDADVRFTVGRFNVEPNAPSVIPGRVTFSIDLRHCSLEQLNYIGLKIMAASEHNDAQMQIEIREISHQDPIHFDRDIQELCTQAADALCCSNLQLLSGAGHDAGYVNRLCKTGMIFIPCKGGISHHFAEAVDDDDLTKGAAVLASTLIYLADA